MTARPSGLTRWRQHRPSLSNLVALGVLALSLAAMLLPVWAMATLSLLPHWPPEVNNATNPLAAILWPHASTLEHYAQLLHQTALVWATVNSVLVTVLTVLVHVPIAALAGYAFARFQFPGKTLAFWLVLATLMIPPQINIIPLFVGMKHLGWMNRYEALVIPGWFGAFGVFLMRQWFLSLPRELEEAAALDGCSPWATFWRIAFPMATPAVVSLSVFVVIGTWNSFLWPLVVTHDPSMATLPVAIATLKGSFRDVMEWPLMMAAVTLSVIPPLGLFVWAQRFLIRGILAGGVKE